MAVIAAATSRADFYTVGTTAADTTAAYIAAYAKEGVSISDPASFIRFPFPALSEGWIQYHFRAGVWGTSGSGLPGELFALSATEGSQPLFQLDFDGPTEASLEYWNGTAFVEAHMLANPFVDNTRYKIDINFKLHETTGFLRVYVNDALIWEYTGDTIFTAATTLGSIDLASPNLSGSLIASALIIADEDTRSMIFHQGQATADGANTAWTGTYTDVTELDRDDTDLIESGTADQLETFVMDDVNAALADYVPRAVVLSTRARRGVSGPQNLQGVVRQSGVDYPTASISGLNTAYGTRQAVMAVNPATSAAWTIAEVNAAEFGVKSVA